ncbi:MAG: dTDP-4-dehydrorhamnose reductase [Piscinibacter sp.]|nr:dTDP-4-dehydrorhamnose reductase [Piscinibacter sp.]
MKVLLLGRNGQVGWELQRSLAVLGDVVAWGRDQADLASPAALAEAVRKAAPDVIVNAAAYTAVDRAESEPELARTINAEAPAALAREAARRGAWLLHYSTDYVFDGSGHLPWTEEAPTGPLGVYGRTKLEGEAAIRASGCQLLILRTSWVYGTRGGNFARTMLRLAQERDRLKVVNDQFGVPTGADLLADLSAHLLRSVQSRPELGGTYHAAPAGETNWHAYARHVIGFARSAGVPIKVADDAIEAVPTEGFPTAATRPRNSRLDTRKLRDTFGLALPGWQAGVDRMLAEVLGR